MKVRSHSAALSALDLPQKRARAQEPTPRRHILVVDDEDYILVLMEEVLRILGYQPLTAANVKQALQILALQPIDLIITDMEMPGMSGIHLLQQVKETHPSIPVVLITGYGLERAARIAEECGADGFLGKPFHIEELRFCISRLIED
jgi:two-component system NtrC family response regulator